MAAVSSGHTWPKKLRASTARSFKCCFAHPCRSAIAHPTPHKRGLIGFFGGVFLATDWDGVSNRVSFSSNSDQNGAGPNYPSICALAPGIRLDTVAPTSEPTAAPTRRPSAAPTGDGDTVTPTAAPATTGPTDAPVSSVPTTAPTAAPVNSACYVTGSVVLVAQMGRYERVEGMYHSDRPVFRNAATSWYLSFWSDSPEQQGWKISPRPDEDVRELPPYIRRRNVGNCNVANYESVESIADCGVATEVLELSEEQPVSPQMCTENREFCESSERWNYIYGAPTFPHGCYWISTRDQPAVWNPNGNRAYANSGYDSICRLNYADIRSSGIERAGACPHDADGWEALEGAVWTNQTQMSVTCDEAACPPTMSPTMSPTVAPSSSVPTAAPTATPTTSPTTSPTLAPTTSPTLAPTERTDLSDCGADQATTITTIAQTANYFVGDSITLPGFVADGCDSVADAFRGYIPSTAPQNVTFGLEIDAADEGFDYELCISNRGGRTTISPLAPMERDAPYDARLVARDGIGSPILIASWSLLVQRRVGFELNGTGCASAEMDRLEQAIVEGSGTSIAVSGTHQRTTTVIVPGFNTTECPLSSLFSNYRRIGRDATPDITFKLNVTEYGGDFDQVASLGENTFVNSDTGKLSLTLDTLGHYTVILQAVSGDQQISLVSWEMRIREGPNGEPCAHGDPADAESNVYICVCTDGFTGENCNDPPAESGPSASDDDSATGIAAGATFGAMLLALAAVIVGFKMHVHRVKHSPVDMSEYEDALRAEMGATLPSDIGKHQFGMTLTFDKDVVVDDERWVQFQETLVARLSDVAPAELYSVFQKATVTRGLDTTSQVLVVVPRLLHAGCKSDVTERAVATINKKLSKLVVDGCAAVRVSLALPRRIPRDIPRKYLTRFTELGHGGFGLVELFQVHEKDKGLPPYNVAAKSIRPGATSGREELLREAALTAMMMHQNVVGLIGIVSVPRDLPALVLLEYCEGGTLLHYVIDKGTALTTVQMLTCVAQVLQGLQYISARHVVHRDVAARNVLLDVTGVCKVSDFGMSVSLQTTGIYSKQYVRLQQEVALRWAAPEALQDGRYSSASDVWSCGVLIWEVFHAAVDEPYEIEHPNLGEVSAFVKGGGRLSNPSPSCCPAEIFEQLMLSCWADAPEDRPTFGDLYDVAVRHGAEEDEDAVGRSPYRRRSSVYDADDPRLLAPSVQCLSTEIAPELNRLVAPLVQSNLAGNVSPDDKFPLMDADMATSYHVKDYIVLPRTRDVHCCRDGEQGAIFVDTLVGAENVGPATAIL